jgi:small subunit ribosomal protein S21
VNSDPGGLAVRLNPGEPIDGALRRFKKALQKAGLDRELRKREHFTPPSLRRREKSRAARRRVAGQ